MVDSSFFVDGGIAYNTSAGTGFLKPLGSPSANHFALWSDGFTLADAGSPSGGLLDDLTGFSGLGVLRRTGTGSYGFLGVGVAANDIPQLDGSARLPVVDGSLLTSLSAGNLTGALPALNAAALVNLTPIFINTQATGANAPPVSTFGQTAAAAATWLEVNTTFPFGPYTWFLGQNGQGAVLAAEHSSAFNPANFTTTDLITSSVYFVHDDTTSSPLYNGGWANYWVAQRNADAAPNVLIQMLEASYVNLGSTKQADPYNVSDPSMTNALTIDSGVGISASFTGTISGTTLTAASVTGRIFPKYPIVTGAAAGTYIVKQLTGTTNGAGTYQVSIPQTVASPTAMVVHPQTATTAIQVSANDADWFNALRVTYNAVALAGSGYYEALQLASQPPGSAGGGHAIVWYAGTPGTPGTVSAAIEVDTAGLLHLACGAGVAIPGLLQLSGSAGGIQIQPRSGSGDFVWYNPTGADLRVFSGGDLFLISPTQIKALQTTASTSTSTGALVSAGGLGVAGAAFIGGAASIAGNLALGGALTVGTSTGPTILEAGGHFTEISDPTGGGTSVIFLGDATGGAIDYRSTAHNWQDITGATFYLSLISTLFAVNVPLSVTATTASTSTTTGALKVAGGLGVVGALFVGGRTTPAASATGGAGFSLLSGTAPTSPVDGDIWYDGTNVKFRVGATTKTFTLT